MRTTPQGSGVFTSTTTTTTTTTSTYLFSNTTTTDAPYSSLIPSHRYMKPKVKRQTRKTFK
ncbi:hypothetical protein E2C01_057267 [Portunus trituberculatus]|uniref:Uncharacterized protein n=1 Tax=Portunus trituberculatus TaxID=210409 RepID=A0A5B7H2V9_PORTR|nr:hypothetical protein [Portunus trituberculatus]